MRCTERTTMTFHLLTDEERERVRRKAAERSRESDKRDLWGNPCLTDKQFETALETLGIQRTMDRFVWRFTRKQLGILEEMIFADETPEEREERYKDLRWQG
jgi:hypothetical protein